MLCPVILFLVACVGFAEAGILAETIRFNRDANFVYSKYAYGPIDYVEFDGKRIPATPANKPCAPDKDCWKEIKGSNYYIATGPLQGPHASVTVEPAVGVGGNPYIFAYKKQHVPTPAFPNKIKPYYTQDVRTNEQILHHVVFFKQPGKMTWNGAINGKRRDNKKITLLGMNGLQKDDHVIFTGRMGNRQRKVFIKFKGGTSYALKLVPTAGTWKAVVTFVDNTQPLTSDNSRVMYETLRFNKNGNYVYSKYAYGPVDYVEFDGKRIPATPANKPCAPDNDCWKEIKKTQYYIFEGRLRAPLASITVEPAADVGGHPYHFVYKKPNAQCPAFPNNVKPYYIQNVGEQERVFHHVVFLKEPGKITWNGPVNAKTRNLNSLNLLGMAGLQKDDHVLFTGRLGDKERKMLIQFKSGVSYILTIEPVTGTWKPAVTFVDNTKPQKAAEPVTEKPAVGKADPELLWGQGESGAEWSYELDVS